MINEFLVEYPILRGRRELKPILSAIGDRGFVCGSFAAWCASPCPKPMRPNDVDVFAVSESMAGTLAYDLSKAFNSSYVRENDLCYQVMHPGFRNIQIVRPNPSWQTLPDDIINDFDFDVSRAYVLDGLHVMADVHIGFEAAKVLRVNNPMKSLKRVLKYHKRGIEFNDHELLKLFSAWEALSSPRRGEIVDRIEEEWRIAQQGPWDDVGYDVYSNDDWFEGE